MQGSPLILPLPPSTNNLYVGNGRFKRNTNAYRAWSKEAGLLIMKARGDGSVKRLGAGWYYTHIHWPFNDRADADNRTKALHDLLHHMQLTPDDKWLFGSTQMRSKDCKDGKCQVWYWSVDPDQPFSISSTTNVELRGVVK